MTDTVAGHGEGPVWDAASGRMLWVDLFAGDVLGLDESGAISRTHVSNVVAAVAPRRGGGLVAAVERGFALIGVDGQVQKLPPVWSEEDVRMNDGGCDPLGNFYCGSMEYEGAPGRGALYRLDPAGGVDVVFDAVAVSNGMGWSPDGSVAYYIDSPTFRIDRCPGDLNSREAWVSVDPDFGAPDGLTVDAEGGVWVAFWGGGQVRRYSSEGDLDVVVDVPVRQTSSCGFGGPDLDTLYITTSSLGLADPEPEAGSLYAVRPGVRGLPTLDYAG